VKRLDLLLAWAAAAAIVCSSGGGWAQESVYQQIRFHNASMAELQPAWMTPLMQSDAKLGQAVRVSVSNYTMGGNHVLNYGNGRGISMIAGRRFQIDMNPPSFFRNHSSSAPDGFGNAATQLKYRIISGNAAHGNFAVSALLYHAFAPRIQQNLLLTSYYAPYINVGKGFGRFAVISNIGAFLPTGKIEQQGRAVEWNTTAQFRATAHMWFDVENQTAFFHAGPFDGLTQSFVTPAAFVSIRRKSWKPEHAYVVLAAGEQVSATSFHLWDHNVVTELRVVY
jgi:hypothetical protein